MTALHVDALGHGPPLVLLHGWAMHSGMWGSVVPRLAKRHRVHAADLPGHGRSPVLPRFTLDGVVEALETAFAGEHTPLVVVGWSLGGLVALKWALARPARIERLVLVATSPRFAADAAWEPAMSRETLQRFGNELDVAWKATVLRFLTLQMRGSEHGHAALAALRSEIFARGEPSRRTLAQSLEVLCTTDLRADAGQIAQPALVLSGARDTLAPAAAGQWLAAALPNARFVSLAGAAHVPFLSHPDEFDRALGAFLRAG